MAVPSFLWNTLTIAFCGGKSNNYLSVRFIGTKRGVILEHTFEKGEKQHAGGCTKGNGGNTGVSGTGEAQTGAASTGDPVDV